MSMPKGHKSKHGYATIHNDNSRGFREIAEAMTADGDEMNHSTARNILIRGLMKIAHPLAKVHSNLSGKELEKEAWRIASDSRFHEGLQEIIVEELRRKTK